MGEKRGSTGAKGLRGNIHSKTQQVICHLCSLDSEWSDDNMDVFLRGAVRSTSFGSKGVERAGGWRGVRAQETGS